MDKIIRKKRKRFPVYLSEKDIRKCISAAGGFILDVSKKGKNSVIVEFRIAKHDASFPGELRSTVFSINVLDPTKTYEKTYRFIPLKLFIEALHRIGLTPPFSMIRKLQKTHPSP